MQSTALFSFSSELTPYQAVPLALGYRSYRSLGWNAAILMHDKTHVVQRECMLWFSDILVPLWDAGWELELCLEAAQPTSLLQSWTSACLGPEGNLGNGQRSAICTPPAPRTRQYSTICTVLSSHRALVFVAFWTPVNWKNNRWTAALPLPAPQAH